MGFYMKMLKVEIHLLRYSTIPLFRIPPFPESQKNLLYTFPMGEAINTLQ